MVRNEKKAKQNNSTSAKLTTPIDQTTNLNDEAAGKLSYSDLHRIVTAALEGRHNQQHANCALANNYASLMCLFEVKIHAEKESITSSIFMQNKHVHLEEDTENAISLTEMRAANHKLQHQIWNFPYLRKQHLILVMMDQKKISWKIVLVPLFIHVQIISIINFLKPFKQV